MTAASDPPATPELTRATRVVVSERQVSAGLEGEVVILSTGDGVYYGLGRVGARIWDRLATPTALGDVLATVVDEFEVEEEVAWRDLTALTRELMAHGLAVVAAD